MKSFWKVVGTIVAIKFAVGFVEGAIKGFTTGLYKSGAFKDVFDKLEKQGYDIGLIINEDREDKEETEDKIVGFKA